MGKDRTPSYQAKCRIRIRTGFQVFDPLGRVQNGQKFGNWRVCRVRKTRQKLWQQEEVRSKSRHRHLFILCLMSYAHSPLVIGESWKSGGRTLNTLSSSFKCLLMRKKKSEFWPMEVWSKSGRKLKNWAYVRSFPDRNFEIWDGQKPQNRVFWDPTFGLITRGPGRMLEFIDSELGACAYLWWRYPMFCVHVLFRCRYRLYSIIVAISFVLVLVCHEVPRLLRSPRGSCIPYLNKG